MKGITRKDVCVVRASERMVRREDGRLRMWNKGGWLLFGCMC
jgi:hypothetical protein